MRLNGVFHNFVKIKKEKDDGVCFELTRARASTIYKTQYWISTHFLYFNITENEPIHLCEICIQRRSNNNKIRFLFFEILNF